MAKVINVYNVPEGRALRVPVGSAFVNVHGCGYLDGIEGLEEVLIKRPADARHLVGGVENIAYVRGKAYALLLANAMNLSNTEFEKWAENFGLSSSEKGVAEACFEWVLQFLVSNEDVVVKEKRYD